MLTSSLARTPGNRFVIPTSSTAAAAGAGVSSTTPSAIALPSDDERARGCYPGPAHLVGLLSSGRRSGGNRDGPADDLLLQVVQLRLERVDGRVRGGVVDAPCLQVERLDPTLKLAI